MQSSRPSIPPRPRRFDGGRRTEAKPVSHMARREDKNISSVSSSPRRVTRGPPEASRLKGIGQSSRSTVTQPKLVRQQKNGPTAQPVPSNSKPKVVHAAPNLSPSAVDPNCNEPSLPCLCCDDHPVQDSNSLFNHNHNNNNTVAIKQQLKLASPPHKDKEADKKPEIARKAKCKPEEKQQPVVIPVANQVEDGEEENGNEDEKGEADHKDEDADVKVNAKVDENGNDNDAAADVVVADVVVNKDVDDNEDDDDDDDDDDEDDNTLVPSYCDCPASMLDFSLTSSTSSSSTSISSCSDLESDCPDSFSLSMQEQELYPASCSPVSSVFQPCSLPLDLSNSARPPPSPCSPDEGYPSASLSPSSDFMDCKGHEEEKGIKVDLLNFLDSIDELGKVDRFYRIVQVAQWELESDLDLRDRLVHQERLEKVNKQVKLVNLERLQDTGLDFEEEDLSDVLDEMGNIDISWKMFKSDRSCDSQEYSDAGVDMTAPSDLDEPPAPDSLVPSPEGPPPRPPKPPARYISGQPELHTYMNVSGNTPSVSSASSPVKSFSLSVSASPSASAVKPPALPPPPSQPVPYFSLYSDSPTLPCPSPPIPPPRRRHKARLEAQRLAELEKEKTPHSLPAPTSRPPPLPPPPVTQPSPPAIPPPPSLPPPPSFHALDVEIRKLLALAGITQAELLRLSPELGVCVDGILEDGEISEISNTNKEDREDVAKESDFTWRDELKEESKLGKGSFKGVKELHTVNEEETALDEKKEGSRNTFRTTSFTEMARRRKRNGGTSNSSCSCDLTDNASLTADSYYSTDISNKQCSNASFGNFDYASVIPDSPPPPPPPRPLPPRPQILSSPPELPPLKPCTLLANASRPDRFDWLIAFTPDTEAPLSDMKKYTTDAVPQKTSSGAKVTTFKELRNRGKQASPPAQVQPEPEPTVITPDPDFLYNLKWRREKADGDGTQWEYTSQAQATFLQPPPTPASLALFREMRHLNIQGHTSVEPTNVYPAIRCDPSDFTEDRKRERKVLEEAEMRGTADGGRTWEARTRASSPLSLALPHPLPSPYYLHSSPRPQPPLFYRSDFYRSQSKTLPFPQVPRIPSDSIRDVFPDSLYCTDSQSKGEFICHHKNPSSNSESIIDSLYQHSRYCDNKKDKICSYENDSFPISNFSSVDANCFDSNSNIDSLCCGDKYRMKTLTFADTNTCAEGNTTPYKNIDMINYINAGKLNDLSDIGENAASWFDTGYKKASSDLNSNENTMENTPQTFSFPTLYLYHPKNCPMHKGAPPRLSPIGAISPPLRGGSLSPGVDVSRLSSPLFPRSHTLPALAAPLYYPYLYTPRAQAPLPEPKLHSQQCPSPPLSLTVRSLSFAGSAAKGAWMGSDVRTPLRGDGLSSLCLQEKRALVSAVSVAVEAILAQFSSSRTLVQKALSGDSSVNPTLGRLVLQCLCPALRDLLSDGLKPHQSDLIAGRRPNSPWSLVQASTKPGPSTQALYSLQVKVAGLPQLKHNRHRFNSFLLGLLNIKRLDFWLSHLHSCSDVLETYYKPTAFIRLSATSCQPLFEELLLLLQPLSLLTFNLDLLFQHHHLDPASPDFSVPRPPKRGFSFHLLPTSQSEGNVGHLKRVSKQDLAGLKTSGHHSSPTNSLSQGPIQVHCRPAIGKGETSPQLQWLKEKEIEAAPSAGNANTLTQQAGQALQEGWGAVMRWGERLGQNLGGLSSAGSSEKTEAEDGNPYSTPNTQKSPGQEVMLTDSVPWGLGRLFGAPKSPNNPPTKRRPSQWLSPGITVLSRMTSAGQAFLPEKIEPIRKGDKEKEITEEEEESRDRPKPLRAVRTLCDHSGMGPELSFRKGEELIVLGGVDQDWIRCRQGDKEGLVPIGYASLIM